MLRLNSSQIDKVAGYFIDLSKVWFASGVVGFFVSEERLTFAVLGGSVSASIVFLAIGISILKSSSNNL
jgi:hypothetical protein